MAVGKHNRGGILYNDVVIPASLSATSAAANFPVTNLQTFQPQEYWRSTTLADQTIISAFTNAESITTIALWRHNLTTDATIRVRISPNADLSSPVYDNTFYAWPSLHGWDMDFWDFYGWDGLPDLSTFDATQYYTVLFLDLLFTGTATGGASTYITLPSTLTKVTGGDEPVADIDDFYAGGTITITGGTGSGQTRNISSYTASNRRITPDTNFTTPPDSTSTFRIDMSFAQTSTTNDYSYTGAYLGITISDAANSAGYMQVGVAKAGVTFQPDYDIGLGCDIVKVDPSQQFMSYGQNKWVNKRNKYRQANFSFPFLLEGEARGNIDEIAAIAGNSKAVLYIPFVENTFRIYTDVIYGLLMKPISRKQVRQANSDYSYESDFLIEELI